MWFAPISALSFSSAGEVGLKGYRMIEAVSAMKIVAFATRSSPLPDSLARL